MNEEVKSLREKIEGEIGPADWKVLRPHLLRDAVIIVAPDLDLIDVGVEVAENNSAKVGKWIEEGKLTKPTPKDAEAWEKGKVEPSSIVVAPYVLVQNLD